MTYSDSGWNRGALTCSDSGWSRGALTCSDSWWSRAGTDSRWPCSRGHTPGPCGTAARTARAVCPSCTGRTCPGIGDRTAAPACTHNTQSLQLLPAPTTHGHCSYCCLHPQHTVTAAIACAHNTRSLQLLPAPTTHGHCSYCLHPQHTVTAAIACAHNTRSLQHWSSSSATVWASRTAYSSGRSHQLVSGF